MASVDRFIRCLGIPALLLAYSGYLVWDHSHQSDAGRSAILRRHLANVEAMGHVDGLLVGGSNAVFSLSAAELGALSGMDWYNASLLNEGFSDPNYRGFIRRLASRIERDAVRLVVYSTLLPLRANKFDERHDFQGDTAGHAPLTIKPNVSAWNHVIRTLSEGGVRSGRDYPLPTADGDMRFDQFGCARLGEDDENFEQDRVEAAARSMADMAEFFASTFPNARIVVVLPSEYYASPGDEERRQAFVETLFAKATENLAGMDAVEAARVRLLDQPSFPSYSHLCDARHHANEAGRAFRTRDLFERLTGD